QQRPLHRNIRIPKLRPQIRRRYLCHIPPHAAPPKLPHNHPTDCLLSRRRNRPHLRTELPHPPRQPRFHRHRPRIPPRHRRHLPVTFHHRHTPAPQHMPFPHLQHLRKRLPQPPYHPLFSNLHCHLPLRHSRPRVLR